MKVLVTGASGMIGSDLVRRLKQRPGLQIRALRRSGSVNPEPEGDVEWVHGDLLSASLCKQIVRGIDLVFHLAHPSVPLSASPDSPGASVAAIEASLNLLNALVSTRRGARLVYASSGGAVYSGPCGGRGFREDSPLLPTSVYGIEKVTIEHHIRLLTEQKALRAVVLRIGNAYGQLLPTDRQQGFIGTALSRALNKQPIRIIGSLENVRDYVYLDDVGMALERCMELDADFETLNIGTGIGTSVRQILAMFEDLLGYEVERQELSLSELQSLPPWSVLDPSRSEALLKWRHRISVKEGIQAMLVRDERYSRSRDGVVQ